MYFSFPTRFWYAARSALTAEDFRRSVIMHHYWNFQQELLEKNNIYIIVWEPKVSAKSIKVKILGKILYKVLLFLGHILYWEFFVYEVGFFLVIKKLKKFISIKEKNCLQIMKYCVEMNKLQYHLKLIKINIAFLKTNYSKTISF